MAKQRKKEAGEDTVREADPELMKELNEEIADGNRGAGVIGDADEDADEGEIGSQGIEGDSGHPDNPGEREEVGPQGIEGASGHSDDPGPADPVGMVEPAQDERGDKTPAFFLWHCRTKPLAESVARYAGRIVQGRLVTESDIAKIHG